MVIRGLLSQRPNQNRIDLSFVDNSKSKVYNYGASVGVRYQFTKALWLVVMYLICQTGLGKKTNDRLEAFNTPQWILNMSLSNRNLGNGWGMALNYSMPFVWQSSLATGTVPVYSTLRRAGKLWTQNYYWVKLGATNFAQSILLTFAQVQVLVVFIIWALPWNYRNVCHRW